MGFRCLRHDRVGESSCILCIQGGRWARRPPSLPAVEMSTLPLSCVHDARTEASWTKCSGMLTSVLLRMPLFVMKRRSVMTNHVACHQGM